MKMGLTTYFLSIQTKVLMILRRKNFFSVILSAKTLISQCFYRNV